MHVSFQKRFTIEKVKIFFDRTMKAIGNINNEKIFEFWSYFNFQSFKFLNFKKFSSFANENSF